MLWRTTTATPIPLHQPQPPTQDGVGVPQTMLCEEFASPICSDVSTSPTTANLSLGRNLTSKAEEMGYEQYSSESPSGGANYHLHQTTAVLHQQFDSPLSSGMCSDLVQTLPEPTDWSQLSASASAIWDSSQLDDDRPHSRSFSLTPSPPPERSFARSAALGHTQQMVSKRKLDCITAGEWDEGEEQPNTEPLGCWPGDILDAKTEFHNEPGVRSPETAGVCKNEQASGTCEVFRLAELARLADRQRSKRTSVHTCYDEWKVQKSARATPRLCGKLLHTSRFPTAGSDLRAAAARWESGGTHPHRGAV
eukprot:8188686-Pyramimonas_sp.AAC.1